LLDRLTIIFAIFILAAFSGCGAASESAIRIAVIKR
jgi:hypothetical protein